MTVDSVQNLVGLLLVAVTVALFTKKIRVPYTVALVLVGLVAGVLWKEEPIHLDKNIILFIFLPPLLFEGCLNMDLEVLRRNALAVFLLAVPGIILCVLGLGAALHWSLGLSWGVSFLVAAIISPTDPVSVLAIFRELGVGKDLSVIVEGESVFNDGIGVVLYLIIYEVLTGGEGAPDGAGAGLMLFLLEVGVGAGVGLLLGIVAYYVLSKTEDHLVEVALSLLLAYGAFIAADRLHGSGVISVVAAGLIMGNYGRIFAMAPEARIALSSFWEVAAFLVNSLVFILIGTGIHPQDLLSRGPSPEDVVEDHLYFSWWWIPVAFLLLMVLRFGITYGLMALNRFLRRRPPLRWTMVIAWGGLRGTIPIALVLGLSGTFGKVAAEDLRPLVFGVVLLSLLVQGLTIRPLLQRLRLVGLSPEEKVLEEVEGRALAARAAENELEAMKRQGEIPPPLYDELRVELEEARKVAVKELQGLVHGHPEIFGARRGHIRRRILGAQRVALQQAARRGVISDEVLRELSNEIDAHLAEGLPGTEE